MQSKIVARFQDGRLKKGISNDFMPNKDLFHLVPAGTLPGARPEDISMRDLKAVFFVKDYAGNPNYADKKEFNPAKPAAGRKIKVLFADGELLIGTTQGYQPGRPGFFVFPADPQSNIDRCYVVSSAAREVSLL
ncbi:MAG: hypothetical protein M0042_10090 [Nitrospiraceae bacterium]|nr:hypothetical protein [Nitrospiraceae bacterium]